MNVLGSLKGPAVRRAIDAAGASLLHLAPNSPNFNPVESALADPMALLRKPAERTAGALWNLIGARLDAFDPRRTHYFTAKGYNPFSPKPFWFHK